MIDLKNLTKRFGNLTAVESLTLQPKSQQTLEEFKSGKSNLLVTT